MQHNRVIRITSRLSRPLAEFVQTDPTLKRLAADCGQTPLDYVASEFMSEVQAGEQYPEWLVRHVKAVLETRMLADKCRDVPGGHHHVAHRIERVAFDAGDRQYIQEEFAGRADVREAWEEAHLKKWAKAA